MFNLKLWIRFKVVSWIIFNIAEKIRGFAARRELKLAQAITVNDLATVKQLLEQGVNPNVSLVGQKSEPAIFLVFQKNWFTLPEKISGDRPTASYSITVKEECLALLLEHGANPNVRNSLGRTILEIAIVWCMSDIVKLLLLNGADPNLRERNSLTPLMKTVILGIQDARPMEDKLQIITHLLDSGADINAQTSDGKTALMYAVSNVRMIIVEFLVSSGASLSITDDFGNRASDLIPQKISLQQQRYLRKILTQPQLNIGKYKYQQFVPEGDRLLASLIDPVEGDRDSTS